MDENFIESFNSQYVKIINNNKEILNGNIIDILEDNVIFQTEIGRTTFPMKSINNIITYNEIDKKRNIY